MSKHVPASVECQIGGRTFKLETGKIAKLASGAVVATYGDTVVLATDRYEREICNYFRRPNL